MKQIPVESDQLHIPFVITVFFTVLVQTSLDWNLVHFSIDKLSTIQAQSDAVSCI